MIRKSILVFLILFSALDPAISQAEIEGRQACFKFEGLCEQHPEWGGTRDDADWAYINQGVGQDRDKCVARAKEYFDWCGNRPSNPVRMVHIPTGW
jgi:hypothetical protein